MKKERNQIFQNNSSSSYFYPGVPQMGVPYLTESNSNFYQGPAVPNNMMNGYMNNDYINELEARLAKIERQLNRFDTRISKLESDVSMGSSNEYNSNNMYMI